MDLTIVIVNWNGGQMLLRCLETIRDSVQSFTVKVILVDNDSSDGSREEAALRFPEFKVVNSGGNIGFGRANNVARTMVDTPLVLFLNPDTELKPDTLETSVRCLRDHDDVGALGCKMRYPDGRVQEQGLQWFPSPWTIFLELLLVGGGTRNRLRRWLPMFDPNKNTYIRKLYGGFVLARRDVLDAVGWFDDRYFMYAEDVDLSRSILDNGGKLFYCADAEIIHVSGGTSKKAPSGFSILMKNESINKLMRKYHGPTGAFLHRVIVFVGAVFRQLVTLPLWVLGRFSGRARAQSWQGSLFRQNLAMLWALGLRKPFVAQSR